MRVASASLARTDHTVSVRHIGLRTVWRPLYVYSTCTASSYRVNTAVSVSFGVFGTSGQGRREARRSRRVFAEPPAGRSIADWPSLWPSDVRRAAP